VRAQLYATQQEWKRDHATVARLPDAAQTRAMDALRAARRHIEAQSAAINEEVEQVHASKRWIREWTASLEQLGRSIDAA